MLLAIVLQSIAVALQLALAIAVTVFAVTTSAGTPAGVLAIASGLVLFVAPLGSGFGLALYVSVYSVHKAMGNLRLIFSADGVTYASDAGTFTAPWTAVKRIGIRRGRYLRVRAPRWGGPISGFCMFSELIIRLDETSPAWHHIRQSAAYFSNGIVTPR